MLKKLETEHGPMWVNPSDVRKVSPSMMSTKHAILEMVVSVSTMVVKGTPEEVHAALYARSVEREAVAPTPKEGEGAMDFFDRVINHHLGYACNDEALSRSYNAALAEVRAQGEHIAALEEDLARAKEDVETNQRVIAEEVQKRMDAELARDEARAELAKAREVIAEARATEMALENERDHYRQRALAAESAIAALRQAAQDAVTVLTSIGRTRADAPLTGEQCAEMMRARVALETALSTPAPEHPDTATLRAIRDWADADVPTQDTEWREGYDDARQDVRALLGGSGQARCQQGNEGGPCPRPPLKNGWCDAHQYLAAHWGAAPIVARSVVEVEADWRLVEDALETAKGNAEEEGGTHYFGPPLEALRRLKEDRRG